MVFFEEIRYVDRPQVISEFFNDSNSIDSNNQLRQSEIALEKKWVTQDPYFRLTTTKIGMDVTDAWMLMNHHDLFPAFVVNRYSVTNQRKVPMKAFGGILGGELIEIAERMEKDEEEGNNEYAESPIANVDDRTNNTNEPGERILQRPTNIITYDDGRGKLLHNCIKIRQFQDGNNIIHGLAKFPVTIGRTNNRKRSVSKQCIHCKKLTTCFCTHCMRPMCYSVSNMHARTCFVDHIPRRTSARNI